MTTRKKTESVAAVRLLLKQRKKAVSIGSIKAMLLAAGLELLEPEDLDREFRHVCTKSGQKWLLGGESASQISKACKEKKACTGTCEQKTACKAGKKCVSNGKKVLEKKTVDPSKPTCAGPVLGRAVGFCKIEMSENFDKEEHNMRAMLHNALVMMPIALEIPDEFVFIAGIGNWPKSYRWVEIRQNPKFSGVILCPKKFVRKIIL